LTRGSLFDDHVHSSMSPDARDGVAALCDVALERGLAGLAITDHFDTEPADPGYGHYDCDRLSREVEQARRAYEGRLAILVGAEICFQPVFLPRIVAFLDACPLDFALGSVHWIERELVDRAYLAQHGADAAYEGYLRIVEQAVGTGLFDAIAHLDLPKRHLPPEHGLVDLRPHWAALERILKLMVEQGTALEINVSGWRHGLGEPLPCEAVVRRYRELGGTRITIGTDSHRIGVLGRDIARGQELARRAGFTHVTRFVGRRPLSMPI